MKNKLTKNHQTKFDYSMRKLGFVSILLMSVTFACLLPMSRRIEKDTHLLHVNAEIRLKEEAPQLQKTFEISTSQPQPERLENREFRL